MKITFLTLSFLLCCLFSAFADIAPNPIKAKGIISNGSSDIHMVSERVVVDLYPDSSVVECVFNMKNEGKNQQINIGFPEMNFHHLAQTSTADFRTDFYVQENGKVVQLINNYIPKSIPSELNRLINKMEYSEQPWYLWDSQFEAGETKVIKVRYALPFGQIKNGSRYFTYLLNTGSGWKGSIESAEVVVNLKGISPDLILKAFPENHTIAGNQISWKFSNLEPTTNDDVKIYYEPSKGYYKKMKAQKPDPTFVVNDEVLPANDQFKPYPALNDIVATNDILSIKVLKDLTETSKYTSAKDGVVIIYTKSYVVEKLNKLIAAKSSNKYPLAFESSDDFMGKYDLIVDETHFADKNMLLKAIELEQKKIRKIRITGDEQGKKTIEIKLKT